MGYDDPTHRDEILTDTVEKWAAVDSQDAGENRVVRNNPLVNFAGVAFGLASLTLLGMAQLSDTPIFGQSTATVFVDPEGACEVQDVIVEDGKINLSKTDSRRFVDALENPQEPNEALLRAVKNHSEVVDENV